MTDYLQPVLRFATPEVFTVVGGLVGLFVSYKALGWALRLTLALLARLKGVVPLLTIPIVGGATMIGWGIGEMNRIPPTPVAAITAGSALVLVGFVMTVHRYASP